jgi:hypothetical protein
MAKKSLTERLQEQLDEREERIEELEAEAEDLKARLDGDVNAWALPREIEDEHPDLPLPRLEFVWIPLTDDWGSYVVEYRLVRRHLLGHLEAAPLGSTRTNSSGGSSRKPWEGDKEAFYLPFRDSAHAAHDTAHLGIPLYACPPGVPPRLVEGDAWGHQHQRGLGASARRTARRSP